MRCGPSSVVSFGLAVAAALACGCGQTATRTPQPSQAATPPPGPPAPAASMTHGDHNPHHGGVVFMKGDDLHYEVVLDKTGRAHQLFFTDGMREDLPASIASDVTLTIHRAAGDEERIPMRIDDAGESWIGSGREVAAPAATTVRVAFTIDQAPYWIDIPFGR